MVIQPKDYNQESKQTFVIGNAGTLNCSSNNNYSVIEKNQKIHSILKGSRKNLILRSSITIIPNGNMNNN